MPQDKRTNKIKYAILYANSLSNFVGFVQRGNKIFADLIDRKTGK